MHGKSMVKFEEERYAMIFDERFVVRLLETDSRIDRIWQESSPTYPDV